MAGWTWCVIGLVLFVGEIVIPSGFFLSFLGVSGIVVGLISLTGLVSTWPMQGLLFALFALGLWFAFAGKVRTLLGQDAGRSDGPAGETVNVLEPIAPGESGSGVLWGSNWRIKNIGELPLASGSRAVVISTEGVTLHVRSES